MVGVPPTTLCQTRTSPTCATPPPSGPPSPPPVPRAPAPVSQPGIVILRKLWEREQGPPQAAVTRGEWSSSPPSAPTEKKGRKLVLCQDNKKKSSKEIAKLSGRKKQEKEEENSVSSSTSTPTLSGRTEKVCTSNIPSERLAYLVGGIERKTDMTGCSGASQSSLASSSSTRCPASTSSSSETATQQLPPAKLRSLSPPLINSNGSTLRAHCQQLYIADILRREDDRSGTQLMGEGQASGLYLPVRTTETGRTN
jgi:hypothetical protein